MNIAEILKDCPKGTKLYSPLFGDVILDSVIDDNTYPINVKTGYSTEFFTEEGKFYYNNKEKAECLLFPSKDNHDWSTFKRKKKDKHNVLDENENIRIVSNKVIQFNDFADDGTITVTDNKSYIVEKKDTTTGIWYIMDYYTDALSDPKPAIFISLDMAKAFAEGKFGVLTSKIIETYN